MAVQTRPACSAASTKRGAFVTSRLPCALQPVAPQAAAQDAPSGPRNHPGWTAGSAEVEVKVEVAVEVVDVVVGSAVVVVVDVVVLVCKGEKVDKRGESAARGQVYSEQEGTRFPAPRHARWWTASGG